MPYVKSQVAREYFGVCDATLRSWEKAGKIKCIRAGRGNRQYDIESFSEHRGENEKQENINTTTISKKKYIYARVSSYKQKEDLERQIKYLKEKYPEHTVIKEIASGINFKRKALTKLLDESIKGMVSEVVVAHKDRLCRIAWEHFKWLFEHSGVNLIVEDKQEYSHEQELADDLFSIIHVFSSRHYGARGRKRVVAIQNYQAEETSEAEEHDKC
jgi:predicted site-specific integrase-resolvase